MAEAAPDNSAHKPTVDDLFQILIARDFPPLRAKKQITKALRLGKLRIDFHVAAGARKTRSMRQATPEELEAEQAGKSLDFLYEASPPGGITKPVHPQSWDGIFSLAIEDGRLIVVPHYSQDFPWKAYSFSISNPVVIDHLWPPAASSPAPVEPTDPKKPPPDADKVTLLAWAYCRLLETSQLDGLRGKELRDKVCREIGPHFTTSPRTFEKAKQRYRQAV